MPNLEEEDINVAQKKFARFLKVGEDKKESKILKPQARDSVEIEQLLARVDDFDTIPDSSAAYDERPKSILVQHPSTVFDTISEEVPTEETKYEHELLEASDVDYAGFYKYGEDFKEMEGEMYQPSFTSFLKGYDVGPELQPFKLKWVFGVNPSVKIRNLSDNKRDAFVFVASQGIILYNMRTKDMEVFEGHQNGVSSLCIDKTGQYMVTADVGENSSIIVWDTFGKKPIFTVFDPYLTEKQNKRASLSCSTIDEDGVVQYGQSSEEDIPEPTGTAIVKISPTARYIVTVASSVPLVKFWLWTLGNTEADASHFISDEKIGECVAVDFHPNKEEFIMLSFEKAVYFITWDPKTRQLINFTQTEIRYRKKFGVINDCTYIQDCHECVASADLGAIHVFGQTIYHLPLEEQDLSNTLMYIKTVKISTLAKINCITSIDGLVVIGDSVGRVTIFDNAIKILYWIKGYHIMGVAAISFKLEPRKYRFEDPTDLRDEMFVLKSPRDIIKDQLEDRSEEIEEILYKNTVPRDASPAGKPIILRDFILMSSTGAIYKGDPVKEKVELIVSANKNKVVAMATHMESPYLVVAFDNNEISLFNYDTLEHIASDSLPEGIVEETKEPAQISALQYSPGSLRLGCGKSNGELWFLEPILQEKIKQVPFCITKSAIKKLCFSIDSNYCAYYDSKKTVVLLKFDHEFNWWVIHGKYRSHCMKIKDIMFSPYVSRKFFTIGEDRFLVEYNALKSVEDEIFITKREKIEQSAVPLCFTYLNQNPDIKKMDYILYADNQFKYKLIRENNFEKRGTFLGPAYGCYSNFPVRKIINMPGHDNRYFIFATDRHIGIQLLPITGSPYQYLGMFGHPKQLLEVSCSFDGKYVFTVGKNDTTILMWQCNVSAIDHLKHIGGDTLQPYYCLLEGGATGWLFKEIQDLFYYMQILHQDEYIPTQRIMSDRISIIELPDLMRACGFYPSEFEISALLSHIKNKDEETTDVQRTDLSFLEFVELYINHRPAHGVTLEDLEDNWNTFCSYLGSTDSVERDQLVDTMCEIGEPFLPQHLHICLAILMNEEQATDEEDVNFDFFPEELSFDVFKDTVLGIDENRLEEITPVKEEEEEEEEIESLDTFEWKV